MRRAGLIPRALPPLMLALTLSVCFSTANQRSYAAARAANAAQATETALQRRPAALHGQHSRTHSSRELFEAAAAADSPPDAATTQADPTVSDDASELHVHWKFDTTPPALDYVAGERPSLTIPEHLIGKVGMVPDELETVSVEFHVLAILEIDDVARTFRASSYMQTSWKDWRLAYTGVPPGEGDNFYFVLETGHAMEADQVLRLPNAPSSVDPEAIWRPRLDDAINQVESDDIQVKEIHLHPDGTVEEDLHFIASYTVRLDLTAYPFDKHYLMFTRRSNAYGTDEVILEMQDAGWALKPYDDVWVYHSTGSMVCEHTAHGSAAEVSNTVVFYVRVDRNPNYAVQNEFIPIFLIVIMSAAAYFQELDEYTDRMTIMVTSLLSMMALQQFVLSALPETSDNTWMHYALFTSYALMGYGVLHIIIVSHGLRKDIQQSMALYKSDSPDPQVLRAYYNLIIQGKISADGTVAAGAILPGDLMGENAEEETGLISNKPAGNEVHPEESSARLRTGGGANSDGLEKGAEKDVEGAAPAAQSAQSWAAASGMTTKFVRRRMPRLARLFVEIDLAMRVLHLGVFGIVLIVRYGMVDVVPPAPTCATLRNYF